MCMWTEVLRHTFHDDGDGDWESEKGWIDRASRGNIRRRRRTRRRRKRKSDGPITNANHSGNFNLIQSLNQNMFSVTGTK